ncbi:zinc-dependent metalloprotease [Aureitalea marina]|uniref:zinc-dependent metalloprotease n=1 Tax=Aureitalea marina TaxID=930804 RepID=UPI0026B7E3EF
MWDNGGDAATELDQVMQIRKQAMNRFGLDNIRNGEPYTQMEDVFVPLYFFHRYQAEAAVKLVGGMEYDYRVKGTAGEEVSYVDAKTQRRALESLLTTLDANNLAIPEELLAIFPPRAYGYNRNRESFQSSMGVAFDALSAAATAGDFSIGLLLHPQRANRVIQQKALDSGQLGLEEVVNALIDQGFLFSRSRSDYHQEVTNMMAYRVVEHLKNLAAHKATLPQVKGEANAGLSRISSMLNDRTDSFSKQVVKEIEAFNKAPDKFNVIPVLKIPDGSPIGEIGCYQD